MRYFINVYAVFKRKYSSTTGAQLNKSAIVSPPSYGQTIASVFLALSAKIIYSSIYTSILCLETAL